MSRKRGRGQPAISATVWCVLQPRNIDERLAVARFLDSFALLTR